MQQPRRGARSSGSSGMGPSPASPRQVNDGGGAAGTAAAPGQQQQQTDKLRKRHVSSVADGGLASPPMSPTKHVASFSKPGSDEDIEEVIRQLPDWKSQLSLRGYIVGELMSREHRDGTGACWCRSGDDT